MTTHNEFQRMVNNMTDEQFKAARFPYNHLPDHHISEEIRNDITGVDMRLQFASAEQALAEHGIEVSIKNFAQYEGATQMLNKIQHDQNYI